MKYLHLIRKNLTRKKVRTLFTVLSIFVAFLLFSLLAALRTGFEGGVDLAGADRLITIHKVSIIQPLPESYERKIAAVPGVLAVAKASWFGGVYQDPKNFIAMIAVEPEGWLAMYAEYVLTPAERAAFIGTRTGAIAGRSLADRFGWKVGDRVPIQGTIYQRKDGSKTWDFTLEGIYEPAEKGVDDTQLFFHEEYLDEAAVFGDGTTGWYTVRIADPERAPEVAKAVDALFANSQTETKTTTEKAFVQAFANQVGNIGKMVMAILAAVFFTILLVAGNTMAQSVRERISELAVLKTLGFTGKKLLAMVLAESLAITLVGGLAGLAIGWIGVKNADLGSFLPTFLLRGQDVAVGVALVVALGLVAGLPPAIRALRLDVVPALRRI